MKLELYFYEQCPFCQLVLSQIKRLDITEIEYKNILEENKFRQELYTETNRTTVPCLFIDGSPMFESADICNWLKENANQLK